MGGRRGPGTQRGLEAAAQMQAVLAFAGELHPLTQVGEVAYGRDCSGQRIGTGRRAFIAAGFVGGGGSKLLLQARALSGRFVRWAAAAFRIGRKSPALPRAYQIAKVGGAHAGTLKNYVNRSDREIRKALRGHEKQVSLHQQKIANPRQFIADWDSLPERERAGLLLKWQQDLQRHQVLADIMRGILMERGCEP